MIKVMQVEIQDGKMETEEISLLRFQPENIIVHIEHTCGYKPPMTDIIVDERNDDFITVKVADVDMDNSGLEVFDMLFIGKREDWTGEVMS